MHRFFLRAAMLFALTLLVPSLARASQAPLQYGRKDTLAVAHLDVEKVRAAPFFDEFKREALGNADIARDLDRAKREAGLDVWKDVDGVTAFVGPTIVKDQRDFVVVLVGKFDERKIVALYKKKENSSPKEKQLRDGKIYLIDRGRMALAFRGKHLVVGGAAAVEAALAKTDPASVLPTVREKVEGDALWAAMVPNREVAGALGMVGASSLKSLALGLGFGDGAKFGLFGTFADASEATKLKQDIDNALAQGLADPEVKRLGLDLVLQKVLVKATGADLEILFRLSKAEIDLIRDAIRKQNALRNQAPTRPSAPPPAPAKP